MSVDYECLVEALGDYGCVMALDDENLENKVQKLADTHSFNNDTLEEEIVAFATNQNKKNIDAAVLDAFEAFLNKNKEKDQLAKKPKKESIATPQPVKEEPSSQVVNLPSGIYAKFAPCRLTAPDQKYLKRANKGVVFAKYVGEKFVKEAPNTFFRQISLTTLQPLSVYGGDKPQYLIQHLYKRLNGFAASILDNNADCDIKWTKHVVAEMDQEIVYVYGMVVCELNEPSIFNNCVNIMVDDEKGSSLKVDVSNLLGENSIFPGQFLAFKCKVEGNSPLQALDRLRPKCNLPATIQNESNKGLFRVWIASGPFCSPNTCGYEALCDLMELVRKDQPNVLILMGPFVDRNNKQILDPSMEKSSVDIITTLFSKIMNIIEECNTQVIFQSCFKDLSTIGYFPTDAFELPEESTKSAGKKFFSVPDPAVVSIGGVRFGLSNSEVISHLCRTECFQSALEGGDRVTRVFGELLEQKSFYPIYPPLLPTSQKDMDKIGHFSKPPHVCVFPSAFPASIKKAQSSLLCNPGALIRGTGGTYAKMEINVENGMVSATEHLSCDIVRI